MFIVIAKKSKPTKGSVANGISQKGNIHSKYFRKKEDEKPD